MATYTFNEFTISIVISQGTEDVPLSYEVDFGQIYTSGVITREQNGDKWNVIKGEPLPQIPLVNGPNKFSIEFDDNKEVILTENAVKQLIKNIKDADNNYIPKSTFSGAFDIMYSNKANTPAVLTANTETTKKFLSMTGANGAGQAPAWDTVTKSDVGLGNVENTALSTWDGSTNITKLGTIAEGTIPWAKLSGDAPIASKKVGDTLGALGLVRIGNNINLGTGNNAGEISVNIASKKTVGENEQTIPGVLGLVRIGDNINLGTGNNAGEISVNIASKKVGDTPGTLGLVRIGDNINIDDTTGEISVSKISSCIALNNKQLYISKLSMTGGVEDVNNDGKIIISADGKTITYTITDNDLGENASTSDLSLNSVIMVAPVYGDNPNDNLCYSKVGTDDEYKEELGGSNKGYYKFINNEFTNEGFTITSSSDFNSLKEDPGLYTKNDNPKSSSSWQYWENYEIVCVQDKTNLNKLKFYLKEAVPSPEVPDGADLPDSIKKRIQIRINIAIFL